MNKKKESFLILSNQEWSNFKEILNTPKKPTQALKELVKLKAFNNN